MEFQFPPKQAGSSLILRDHRSLTDRQSGIDFEGGGATSFHLSFLIFHSSFLFVCRGRAPNGKSEMDNLKWTIVEAPLPKVGIKPIRNPKSEIRNSYFVAVAVVDPICS